MTVASSIKEIIRQRNCSYRSCQETNYSNFKSKAILFGNIWCLQDLLSSLVNCRSLDQLAQPVTDVPHRAIVSSHLPEFDVSFPALSILTHSFSSGSGHYILVCDAGVTELPSSRCPVTNNSLTHNIVVVFDKRERESLGSKPVRLSCLRYSCAL